MHEGDLSDGEVEELIATIIENQLQLGAMIGPYVAQEGTYSTIQNPDGSVTVFLSGDPAIKGCVNNAFMNVNGSLQWNCTYPGINYLYINAGDDIFANPASVGTLVQQTKVANPAHLLVGYVDLTIPGSPQLNISPPDKPILLNLITLLTSPINPFGLALEQDNLTVGGYLTIVLTNNQSLSVTAPAGSSQPAIRITAPSGVAAIKGTGELIFGDNRVSLVALTDPSNTQLSDNATSLLGAIAKASKTPITPLRS